MNFKLPSTFYLVAADFEDLGLGNAGDITADRDQAYNDFADSLDAGQPTRVFRIDLDVETNAPEAVSEITEEMMDELSKICAERGLEMPEAA